MTPVSCTITVASYNVRKAIGTDRRRDPQRVLDVLHELDADVVALQEADKRFGGRAAAVPHELIDEHGFYKPVYFGLKHRRPQEKRYLPRLRKETFVKRLILLGKSKVASGV